MEKPSKSFSSVGRILSVLGNISIVYSTLSALSKLNSWDDFMNIVFGLSEELFLILDFLRRVIHQICTPWNWLTKSVFEILHIQIPEEMRDPIILALFLIFIPIQLLNKFYIWKPRKKAWEDFKKHIKPFFNDDLEQQSQKEIIKKLDSLSIKYKTNQIYIFLIGPPIESIILSMYRAISSTKIEINNSKTNEFFNELDSFFSEGTEFYKRFWKFQWKKSLVLLVVITIIAIDKEIYLSQFEITSFYGYTILLGLVIPILMTILSSVLGALLLWKLSRIQNPLTRAEYYDSLESGFPIIKLLFRRLRFKSRMPHNWLKVWGEKLTIGQAIIIYYPNEQQLAKKFVQNNSISELKYNQKFIWRISKFKYQESLIRQLKIPISPELESYQLQKFYNRNRIIRYLKKNDDKDWFLLSKYYITKKQFDQAKKCVNRAIDINPNNFDFWLSAALIFHSENKVEDAINACQKAVDIKPVDVSSLNYLGHLRQQLNHHELAINHFNEALKISPEYHVALNNLAYSNHQIGKYKEATKYYSRAIEIYDKSDLYFKNKALSHLMLNEFEAAHSAIDKAIELDSKNDQNFEAKAVLFQKQKKHKEAIKYYGQAVSLNPSNVNHFLQRAFSRKEVKDFEGTLVDYASAVKHNPNHINSRVFLGQALNKMRRFNEAIHEFSTVLELDQKNLVALNDRGKAFIKLEQFENAIHDLQKALTISKTHSQPFIHLGNAYLGLNELKEAQINIDKGLKLDDQNSHAYFVLGNLREKQNKHEEALALWTKAAELGHEDALQQLSKQK